MSRRAVAAVIGLGWLVPMIAACGYGANPATPVLSPTANVVATEVPSNLASDPIKGPTPAPSPSREKTAYATIAGKLCFGSERIPPMDIFARNVGTGETYSVKSAEGALDYTVDVPAPGNYIVFAWTTGEPFGSATPFNPSDSRGGMYSCTGDYIGQMIHFGKSGARPKCYGPSTPVPDDDHTPLVVPVRPGERRTDIFICDFDINAPVPKP